MQPAEGVRKARIQQLGHLAALLIGEARIHAVGLGVLEVDLLMGHVQIAAQQHGLDLIELLQIRPEVVLPLHAVVQSLQAVLGVGRVAAHQIERAHVAGDDPALVVVLVDADAVGHALHGHAAEHRRAGIALPVGAVEVLLVTGQIHRALPLLHLDLLQAQHVRIQRLHALIEVLADHRAQAVYVPGYQFHQK